MNHLPPVEFDPSLVRVPPGARSGLLLLDFDGTLAPIAPLPENGRMPDSVRRALLKIIGSPVWKVGIVSGRQLSDVQARVDIPGLIYAGNHGFEIDYPGRPPFVHPGARRARELLLGIRDQAAARIAGISGAILEDKIFSLSLHTRLSSRPDERQAHLALIRAARPALRAGHILIRRGKKVLEIRPSAPWDKGSAVRALLSTLAPPRLGIYVGDDNTDEDAFRALRDGVTIRVGHGQTAARFYVNSVDDMPRTLDQIATLLPVAAPAGRA